MKKLGLLLFVSILFNGLTFSQKAPAFVLTKDGVKPVVITLDTSYNSKLIYDKVKEWVFLTYKNPKSAIRNDLKNSVVKVAGFKEKAWNIKSEGIDHWYNLEYTLTVEIKDAKCRVTFEATSDVKYKIWFNKDGTLLKKFKDSKTSFEASINSLLVPLYNQIKGLNKKATDEW